MKILTMAAAAALALATVPAMAQPSDVGNMAYPNAAQRPSGSLARTPVGGRDVGSAAERPTGGRAGYTTGSYGRRPAGRTPSDVGNMAFPDPASTPAGNLPAVPATR